MSTNKAEIPELNSSGAIATNDRDANGFYVVRSASVPSCFKNTFNQMILK